MDIGQIITRSILMVLQSVSEITKVQAIRDSGEIQLD